MAFTPQGLIAAEVCGDGKKPGRKFAARLVAVTVLEDANESLLRKIERIFAVARVAEDEADEGGQPPAHQFVEGKIVAAFEAEHRLDVDVLDAHGFRRAR